jgi:hypothetical protein
MTPRGGDPGKLRHRCRNPRCKMKLREPIDNLRSAFCCRGCHATFYRKRCLVCEGSFERVRDDQRTCGRRKCKGEFRRHRVRFWGKWLPNHPTVPGETLSAPQKPIKPGTKRRVEGRGAWRNSHSPIRAPAYVLDIEVFDRRWEAATSSDGIEIEVARLPNRALVSS